MNSNLVAQSTTKLLLSHLVNTSDIYQDQHKGMPVVCPTGDIGSSLPRQKRLFVGCNELAELAQLQGGKQPCSSTWSVARDTYSVHSFKFLVDQVPLPISPVSISTFSVSVCVGSGAPSESG
ncbi:hypothetical protein KCU88_g169, partial [Aureobasidium melanogenum]